MRGMPEEITASINPLYYCSLSALREDRDGYTYEVRFLDF
jgi:hypothetical protein